MPERTDATQRTCGRIVGQPSGGTERGRAPALWLTPHGIPRSVAERRNTPPRYKARARKVGLLGFKGHKFKTLKKLLLRG